jgi:CheY-like chemotaxis protein/HPt (histidine-containing phosphotransfer) domain-containing protein
VLSHEELPEHQAEALRTIRTSAFSLLRILDDVLDFSKIEAGRMDLEHAPVPLRDLVGCVCATLKPAASDKEVDLDLFIAPQVPEQVWSDATRLRQVIGNLGANAIKFSAGRPQRRGRVSIRMDVTREAQPRLLLRIADNGIGIAPPALTHLFSSFTQAETSTTRRFGGTGLGLAICERLVTLMGGTITVQSALDEGSTFTVTLPLEAVAGIKPAAGPDLKHLDCIVAGSDLDADDLRVYLEHAGARVCLVADLAEAAHRAIGMERPVVIQNAGHDSPAACALQTLFAATADARHLVLVRGSHLRTPMAATDVMTLDANGLQFAALVRAVAVAGGRAPPHAPQPNLEDTVTPPPVRPLTVAEARAQGRLILIAEDDEVNQIVILRQMEVLGYAAEIADNGAEALRLWGTGRYALLLTDLHMPDMDGYCLAQAIRREEAQRGLPWQQRMPILALTANALRGEAMRAHAAGMDEYLTKPLQLHLFEAALRKWLPGEGTTPARCKERPDGVDETPALPATAAAEGAVLKGLIGEDAQGMRELLFHYRTSARRFATALRAAHAANDVRQIGAIANQLKSASRSVGALTLGDLCAGLENACRTRARRGISRGMAQFDAELLLVEQRLDRLLGPSTSCQGTLSAA